MRDDPLDQPNFEPKRQGQPRIAENRNDRRKRERLERKAWRRHILKADVEPLDV